jgi:hypothetical protein
MPRLDTEHRYHWLCRLRGHVWWRNYYSDNWQRDANCQRCEHILKGSAAVAERWRQINAAQRASGCMCGQPATHVRYSHGTVGVVRSETWSCSSHVNVNSWSRSADGTWTPSGDYSESALAWLSDAYDSTA